MRILVTGGLGFLGGRLAAHLLQIGCHVVLGSRKGMSCPPDWLPQAESIKIDWNNDEALDGICKGVDVILHAAGMNAQDCSNDTTGALLFNGVATARLVAAASRMGLKKFIYLSTAHVYADPLAGTFNEDSLPKNLHPYATSHLAGEYAVLLASQRGQFSGMVLRLSNAFGVPMHQEVNCWMLLVNDLCRQAVQTRQLTLRGNGKEQRDFISVSEICRVIELLLVKDLAFRQSGVFNVGSGVSQSVMEMTQIVQQRCQRVLGFEPDLNPIKNSDNNRAKPLVYQINRLKKLDIDPSSKIDVSEIDQLIQYCDQELKLPSRRDS